MRIAYFDCFSGISGDMTVAAFLDAGLDFNVLSRELAKLKLKGYHIKKSKVRRGELSGTKFECIVDRSSAGHRSLKEILRLIEKSALGERVKRIAKDIFLKIGSAEAKVHGVKLKSDIRFHELGDIDSIVDIVSVAIAIDKLGIDEIHSSAVTTGRTFVRSGHGTWPIPAPASIELLKNVPLKITELEAELVTPTGAGILKALSRSFGSPPQMSISKIGYGAGSANLDNIPNMLRIMIAERKPSFKEDRIFVIETNIDDMNPQNFEYLFEKLFKEGALDVYTTSINMKKSRPALKLTALVDASKLERVASVIFSESTTIGIRFYETTRFKLERKTVSVRTKYGNVKVKLSSGPDNISTVSPEYDECVRIARDKKIPLKAIYDEAKRLVAAVFILVFMAFGFRTSARADTIYTDDGKELRGIVVEDYQDRLVFSTADGEITLMKSNIQRLYFDSEEDNLIKLAELAAERRDYTKAFAYYDMAYKLNPNSKAAKDGLVFLQGYFFRKEETKKEDEVKKREDFENYGTAVPTEKNTEESVNDLAENLKKGIGITFANEGATPKVEAVGMNSPAEEAGVKPGDRLVAVWGRLTGYMPLKDLMATLSEKPALELKCTLERVINVSVNGLGASFSMEFDGLTVSAVKEDSSAFEAGLKKGDLVTDINDNSTRYMPLKKAMQMIRHSKDGIVKLTIRREALIWRKV